MSLCRHLFLRRWNLLLFPRYHSVILLVHPREDQPHTGTREAPGNEDEKNNRCGGKSPGEAVERIGSRDGSLEVDLEGSGPAHPVEESLSDEDSDDGV